MELQNKVLGFMTTKLLGSPKCKKIGDSHFHIQARGCEMELVALDNRLQIVRVTGELQYRFPDKEINLDNPTASNA